MAFILPCFSVCFRVLPWQSYRLYQIEVVLAGCCNTRLKRQCIEPKALSLYSFSVLADGNTASAQLAMTLFVFFA